jgi:hypothetical protein
MFRDSKKRWAMRASLHVPTSSGVSTRAWHQKKVRDHLERSFVGNSRDDVDALHGKGMRTRESHTRASTSARHAQAQEPPPPAFPLRTSRSHSLGKMRLSLCLALDIASRAMLVWELTCGRHRACVLLLEHGLVRALAHATAALQCWAAE